MDEKRLTKLLWAVKGCLLAVLVYGGSGIVASRLHLGDVLDPDTAGGEERATAAPIALPEDRSAPDYAQIVQRNLFSGTDNADDSRAGSPPPPTPDAMVPAEELGLRLVGTIAGGPVASRAIIQNAKGSTTGSYRIGDTVASATVETIQRDAAILRYQGRPLVLKLCPGETEDRGQKAEYGRQKTQRAGQTAAPQGRPSSVAEAPPSESSRAGSVAEVFRRATIEPYVKNNRTEGLRISGLDKIPMAERLGLKNGDVVQTVNGQQLTSKQKAFQVLMKARTQPKVDLQLLRDGKNKELSFNL